MLWLLNTVGGFCRCSSRSYPAQGLAHQRQSCCWQHVTRHSPLQLNTLVQALPPTCAQTRYIPQKSSDRLRINYSSCHGFSITMTKMANGNGLRIAIKKAHQVYSDGFTPTGLLRQVYSRRTALRQVYSTRFTPPGLLHQEHVCFSTIFFRQVYSTWFNPPSTCLVFTRQCPTTDELGGCERHTTTLALGAG